MMETQTHGYKLVDRLVDNTCSFSVVKITVIQRMRSGVIVELRDKKSDACWFHAVQPGCRSELPGRQRGGVQALTDDTKLDQRVRRQCTSWHFHFVM